MHFSNSYASLDELFYERTKPVPVPNPRLFLWNSSLAKELMIPGELEDDPTALAQIFSGNRMLPGSDPIATAYAGHQFGSFVPRLGDGRAHLLGEMVDRSGHRVDIQLKGSGRTSFSRGGDGRCALGPAIREFIMSEAMFALEVPTTRSLAVVTTGESVIRENKLSGAVLTRVASSFVRIGTFQYFAAQKNHQALKTLFNYTLHRHYPGLQQEKGADQYIALFKQFMEKQIQLVVEWMRVGFIHGVMNTDNIALSGETIDYGPCAMMGVYDPATVYSSIDISGRYAFGNQPTITQWNLTRFAECLLPLIDDDPKKASDQLTPVLAGFPEHFEKASMIMMGKKLGLQTFQPEDKNLVMSLLKHLEEKKLDYTITFDLLTRSVTSELAGSRIDHELGEWSKIWKKRVREQRETLQDIQTSMRRHNPVVIPRNHHIEEVLRTCMESGKALEAEAFLRVLRCPYQKLAQTSKYQDPPDDGDKGYRTFCGT
jgi:uncharacterized protein YdiU (UPF0061 family)